MDYNETIKQFKFAYITDKKNKWTDRIVYVGRDCIFTGEHTRHLQYQSMPRVETDCYFKGWEITYE